MRSFRFLSLIAVGVLILGVTMASAKPVFTLPEFSQTSQAEWFNSKPLTTQDLQGKVTLIDFWTFACWNCYRSFPWLNSVGEKYKNKDFRIIGIHSPEFDYEKNHASIAAKIKEFQIHHPVMVDNDMAYWRALNNRYWPSYYLVDKRGRVRANFVGETHANTFQSKKIEGLIEALLAE